ncbi:MAG: DNA-processing protein DprA [Candidatus Omnitrophota bacterium]
MLSQDLIDWLRLALLLEVGSRRGKVLLERFKTPKAVLEASLDDIAEVENIGRETAKKIVEGREKIDFCRQIELLEKNNVSIIPLDSEFYPVSLKSIFDPPLVLFVQGEILPQDYFSIGIVGTRMSSFYGRTMAEKLSRQLVERGFTVVSGGARGVDTFSHQSALKANGRTIGILGCGLDITYPPENKNLFKKIVEKGAMVSEFPLGTPPNRQNFPMRNRIISGLSLGTLVIEAPLKSGALITVTHAIEQGREVFSVPGQADSFVSKGTNQLLREGAKLVEDADDIIEELEPVLNSKIKEFKTAVNQSMQRDKSLSSSDLIGGSTEQPIFLDSPDKSGNDLGISVQLSEQEAQVYNLFFDDPLEFDDIIIKSRLPVNVVSSMLTTLQLKKLVKQLPGKVFEKEELKS